MPELYILVKVFAILDSELLKFSISISIPEPKFACLSNNISARLNSETQNS